MIKRLEPQRKLYLALHEEVYEDFFTEPLGEIILSDYNVPIIVFDPDREVIIRWID
nr:element excision factor XisH family protein [Moorena sp. SIO2C4]